MRAWVLDELTGIEHLRLAEIPAPSAGPGEAVLDIRYAALNPADRYLAERQYPAKPMLPHILGRDAAGLITKVDATVTSLKPGARYAVLRSDIGGNRPGTFAEQVVAPAEDFVEVPETWTYEEGAGATLVYLTAYQALTMWEPLPAGAAVLVTGASGGVGVATIQLATAMGHKVLALSRSAEKSRRLQELGATATFNPQDPQWRQAAKNFLKPHRVQLAVDNIGGKLFPEVIDTLGENGRVSVVGRLAGPVPDFNTATLFFRRIRIGGVAVGAYTNAEARAAWQQVVALLDKSGARPLIDSIFSFEELPKAFVRLAEGPLGKVLLRVN